MYKIHWESINLKLESKSELRKHYLVDEPPEGGVEVAPLWGSVGNREGRSITKEPALTRCPSEQIRDGDQVVCSAWITGSVGLGGQFWHDDIALNAAVRGVWRLVQDEAPKRDQEPKPLEKLIARRVLSQSRRESGANTS